MEIHLPLECWNSRHGPTSGEFFILFIMHMRLCVCDGGGCACAVVYVEAGGELSESVFSVFAEVLGIELSLPVLFSKCLYPLSP